MICDCHLRLSSDVTDISSHITKLLKFIVLSQTNSSWRLECILGPILFSIYINDLPSIPQHSSSQCYVEDTKLILNFKLQDHVNAIVKLNGDFSRIGPQEINSLKTPTELSSLSLAAEQWSIKHRISLHTYWERKLNQLPLLKTWELSWIPSWHITNWFNSVQLHGTARTDQSS